MEMVAGCNPWWGTLMSTRPYDYKIREQNDLDDALEDSPELIFGEGKILLFVLVNEVQECLREVVEEEVDLVVVATELMLLLVEDLCLGNQNAVNHLVG
jgi:hypothetical protein